MEFQEEVYTSAASLLEGRGGGNLGVVAKSRGFPREVEADMAMLRGYTLLSELAVENSEQHPPRVTITNHHGNQEWLCLSRVVFAGADHTGRTTPLAHHMAFEASALKARRIGSAALLSAAEPLLMRRWDEPPRWIDPVRSLGKVASPETIREFPSSDWQGLVDAQHRDTFLAAVAQHLIGFRQAKKTVIICLPIAASMKVSNLMADLLALLPEDVQLGLVCATHVIDPSDAPNNAALIFTYPGTPLLKQAQERRDARSPVIFDLSDPDISSSANGDYASVILPVLRSAKAATELSRVRELWDQLGITPDRVGQFRQAILLRSRLQRLAAVDELDAAARQVSAVTAISPSAANCVEQWSLKYVLRALERCSADDRQKALVAVAIDSRWPSALVESATRTIREDAVEFVPYLLRRALADAVEERTLAPLISEVLAANHGIVTQLISKASTTNAPRDKRIAVAALERCGAADSGQLQTWLDAAITASDGMHREIVAPILARLKAASPSPAQYAALRNHYRGRGDLERLFLGEVYLPLLRDSLGRAKPREHWRALVSQLVGAALDGGSESQELAALARMYSPLIDGPLVDEWRRQAGGGSAHGTPRSERLENAIQAAGLGRGVLLAETPHPADRYADGRRFSSHRLPRRDLRQPVGRGPRIASVLLFGATLALLSSPAFVKGFDEIRANPRLFISAEPIKPFFWTSVAIIVAYPMAEVLASFMQLQFATARMARRVILVLLIAALLLSTYRLGHSWNSGIFKWPDYSAKR